MYYLLLLIITNLLITNLLLLIIILQCSCMICSAMKWLVWLVTPLRWSQLLADVKASSVQVLLTIPSNSGKLPLQRPLSYRLRPTVARWRRWRPLQMDKLSYRLAGSRILFLDSILSLKLDLWQMITSLFCKILCIVLYNKFDNIYEIGTRFFHFYL